jgi:hypothetical protein
MTSEPVFLKMKVSTQLSQKSSLEEIIFLLSQALSKHG